MPQPTRSREWFRQQVAALGALLRRLPPSRQEALLEELADEAATPAPDARTVDNHRARPRRTDTPT
jgi:hypothetical protein